MLSPSVLLLLFLILMFLGIPVALHDHHRSSPSVRHPEIRPSPGAALFEADIHSPLYPFFDLAATWYP
jgi:hypothetical protein